MKSYIRLTSSDDDTAILIRTKDITRAQRDEDDEYTRVYREGDNLDNLDVTETPDQILAMIDGQSSFSVDQPAQPFQSQTIGPTVNSPSSYSEWEHHK